MSEPEVGGSLKQGALGPFAITFFVISAAGPLVAMAGGVPVAMLFGNGPGIPAMFVVAAVVLLIFSVGYTAMAQEVRNAGAFYAFAARGLGGIAAGATGLVALLSYNGIQIGLYGLFGAAVGGLLESTAGIVLPWWFYAFAAMLAVAWLGYRQVDLSARILGALVAGEYLVVLVLDVAILHNGGQSGLSLQPFTPKLALAGAPAIALLQCFSAFVGFEATTIYSEEAKDPERTIPLATYLSVILIGGFYALSAWSVVVGAGVQELLPKLRNYADPTTLLFDLAEFYAGSGLKTAMQILFVTSTFAALLAFHNAIARYLFSMGREGILPKVIGRTHPQTSSPHIGSLVQSALALVAVSIFAIAHADPVLTVFTISSAVATLGILFLMAITALSMVRFFTRADGGRPMTVLSSGIALIAFVSIVVLATRHFDVLAGTSSALVLSLPLLVLAAAIAGGLLALRLRVKQPDLY